MANILLGIGWFAAEQWPEVQRTMEDKNSETYAQWLTHALDLEERLNKEGFEVVRYPVDIGDFEIWCRRKGKTRNAAARSEYVVERIQKII